MPDATRALVQAFVSCRLDYCNSLLAVVTGVHHRPLDTQCGSSSGLRHSSLRPCHAGSHDNPPASRPPANNYYVQYGSSR